MRRLCERRGRYEDLLPVVGEGHLCVVNDSLCPRNISTWVGTSIMAALQVGRGLLKEESELLTLEAPHHPELID